MYCGKPGHIATNCNLGKRPGTSLRQMDSTLDDSMDKMSIHDNVDVMIHPNFSHPCRIPSLSPYPHLSNHYH